MQTIWRSNKTCNIYNWWHTIDDWRHKSLNGSRRLLESMRQRKFFELNVREEGTPEQKLTRYLLLWSMIRRKWAYYLSHSAMLRVSECQNNSGERECWKGKMRLIKIMNKCRLTQTKWALWNISSLLSQSHGESRAKNGKSKK